MGQLPVSLGECLRDVDSMQGPKRKLGEHPWIARRKEVEDGSGLQPDMIAVENRQEQFVWVLNNIFMPGISREKRRGQVSDG